MDNQTILEVCEADKKDLEDEVKHLKDIIKSKNLEIGVLKSKLRNSETEMYKLKSFLMSQVSSLTSLLDEIPITSSIQTPLHNSDPCVQEANQDSPSAPINEDLGHLDKITEPSAPAPQAEELYFSATLPVASSSSQPLVPSMSSSPAFPSLVALSSSQVLQLPFSTSAQPPVEQPALPQVSSSSTKPPSPVSSQPAVTSSLKKKTVTENIGTSDRVFSNGENSFHVRKFECTKCKKTFSTSTKLNYHRFHDHGNSSSEDDPFTPIPNSRKNKARKLANKCKKMKISKSMSEEESPIQTNQKTAKFRQVPCPDCGKLIVKCNMTRHRKSRGCKVNIVNEKSDIVTKEQSDAVTNEKSKAKCKAREDDDLTEGNERTVKFMVRGNANGSTIMKKIYLPPHTTVGKVVSKFSKMLAVSMEELQFRCNGRVWGLDETVRDLADQTAWLTQVEVKKEDENIEEGC